MADLHSSPQGVGEVALTMPVGMLGETSTMHGLVCWRLRSGVVSPLLGPDAMVRLRSMLAWMASIMEGALSAHGLPTHTLTYIRGTLATATETTASPFSVRDGRAIGQRAGGEVFCASES